MSRYPGKFSLKTYFPEVIVFFENLYFEFLNCDISQSIKVRGLHH